MFYTIEDILKERLRYLFKICELGHFVDNKGKEFHAEYFINQISYIIDCGAKIETNKSLSEFVNGNVDNDKVFSEILKNIT